MMRRNASLFLLVLAICGMLAAAQHGGSYRRGGHHLRVHKPVYKAEYKPVHKPVYKAEYKKDYVPAYKPVWKPEYKDDYYNDYTPKYEITHKGVDYKYICHLDKAYGWGKYSYERYYYDAYLGKCISFYYKGYGGNGNNFKTYEECKYYCH